MVVAHQHTQCIVAFLLQRWLRERTARLLLRTSPIFFNDALGGK
jgi:hypothetical protein